MASIIKVNTIQDATNSNTALSLDTSGNVTVSNPLTASSGVVQVEVLLNLEMCFLLIISNTK
jgi:hypothetical protein